MEKNYLSPGFDVLVIGGSAGSLEVLVGLLRDITSCRMSIIVVLHRKSSSDSPLADVLSNRSSLRVKEAEEKEPLKGGTVYLAPPDYHLLVESDHTLSLDYSEKVNFSRPSIDVTFESVAATFGPRVLGALLSGGNADGINGLRAIKAAGGMCIVQDPLSAEIAFMPEHAISEGVVDRVLDPSAMARFINSLG